MCGSALFFDNDPSGQARMTKKNENMKSYKKNIAPGAYLF
jgi:hypothetical protein